MTSSTFQILGDHLYTIVSGPDWNQASEQADQLGGYLASINNAEENSFLVDQISGISPSKTAYGYDGYKITWIGLEKPENSWQWSNGEPLTYTNWNGAIPSGDGAIAEISLTKLTTPPATGAREAGDWNDAPDNEQYLNYIAGGIAEIPFIRRDDSAYVIVEGNTWAEAQANALALGGNLTTINNEAENEWITQLISQRDTSTAYWIGLNDQDEDETYTWINGETSSYRAWDANGEDGSPEPSGNTYGAMFGKPAGLNYSFKWIEEGNWYSVSENIAAPLQAVGGSLAGIAEIPLAPNQTPSGQPELQGALEVGQTLRIDPSTINDNDNSEYWSPTYHYSWEVSNNQGQSWTPLESRDANDGNATITLTSNEVGLQLRGRASYLDGMGTKESLTTTASSMGRFRLSADQSNDADEPLIGSTLTIDPVVNINGSNALEYSWQYLSRTQSKALNAFELAREEVALNFNISGDAITGTVIIEDLFKQADYPSHRYSKVDVVDTAHGVLFDPSSIGGSLNQVLASDNSAPYYLPTYKTISAARGLTANSGAALHMELGGFELYLSDSKAGEPIELLSFDSEGNLTGSEELTGAALLNAERELNIDLDDSVDFYGATINSKAFNKDQISPQSTQRVNAYKSSIGLILSGQQLRDNSTIESNPNPAQNDIILLSSNNDGYSLASNQTIRDARWSFDSSDAKIYELYLEGPSNVFEKIVFNSQGALQSSKSLTNAALLHAELELQLDLDGDDTTAGRISGTALLNKNSQTPPHAFTGALNAYNFSNENLGNGIVLSSEQLSHGVEIGKRTISHSQQLITLSDSNNHYQLPANTAIAAAQTVFSDEVNPVHPAEKRVNGYELYLRSTNDDSISKATFNADGSLTSTTPLTDAALTDAELELKLDLDNNGVTATKVANELLNKNNQPAPYPTAETLNVYTSSIDNGLILSSNSLNAGDSIGERATNATEQLIHLSANNQGFNLPEQAAIKLARTQFVNGSSAPADTSIEGYELFVTTTPNNIERFSFDANGVFTGSEPLEGTELINTERVLRFDLNGDGITSIPVGEQLLNKTTPPHTYTGALNVYNSESGIMLTSSTLINPANSWSNPPEPLVVVSKDGKGFQLPKFSSIKAARALYADGTTTPSTSTPAIGYELFLQDWQGEVSKYSLNADGEVLIEEEWKAINTTDAVDGDHTYTLTDADLGRQIRGKITSTNGNGNQLIETTNALDRVSFQLALNGYANIGELIEIDASSIPTNTEILDAGFEQQWPEGTHILQLEDFTWKFSNGKYTVSYRGEELNQAIHNSTGSDWGPHSNEPATIKLNLANEKIEIHLGINNPELQGDSGTFNYLNHISSFNEKALSNTRHQLNGTTKTIIIRPESLATPLPLSFADSPDTLVKPAGFIPHTTIGSDPREIKTFDRDSNLRAFVEVLDQNNDPLLVQSQHIKIGGILTGKSNSAGGEPNPGNYAPNNAPQGDLTIAGIHEAGQLISIDSNAIQDEDGINSDFEYSWQIFDQNINDWLDLSTTDATDGNADLILTSALIGKQLRGHAFYIDGNGLEEHISSNPFTVAAAPPTGPYQEISTPTKTLYFSAGGTLSLPIYYSHTPVHPTGGITIDVHYDSSRFSPIGENNGVTDMLGHSHTSTNPFIHTAIVSDDDDDRDNDPTTDQAIRLSWFNEAQDFPGTELPVKLGNLNFQNLEESNSTDSITGSLLNITPWDQPSDYGFISSSIELLQHEFNLDVNGDGKVSLYSDGIMVIRRLIGLDTCTNGFSFDKPGMRSAEETDALLDHAYEQGYLNFDQAGDRPSLYTDGILLIRYLISPGLVTQSNDLIGANSPYKENPETLINTFDALMPQRTA